MGKNSGYNPEIHHRRSIRLKGYDYAQPGAYFVTICIQDHICVLGEIRNGLEKLSPIGMIARKYWLEIPEHYPQVSLDEFAIMPNHIHGIIIINELSTAEMDIGGRNSGQYPVGSKF